MRLSRRTLLALLAAGVAALSIQPTMAQSEYPARPVRIVVPYPPGGPNDLIARALAQQLTERLHQAFVIDNKPGATGLTGSDQVAKSPADGYTLLVSASVHVIYPSLFRKVPFDPLKDFTGISLLARAPLVMSVHPEVKVRTVPELVALAKSVPGKLRYASSGNGSATHLAAEAFKTQAGVDLLHIPYKGSSPAMADAVAGHVEVIFDSIGSSLPFIRSGKLRPLGVTSAQRSSAAPDLPSIAESGVADYDIGTWYGLWAPAGTPAPVVDKLSREVQAIMRSPAMQERLGGLGIDAVGGGGTEFRAFQVSESAKWARIVKHSGAQLD